MLIMSTCAAAYSKSVSSVILPLLPKTIGQTRLSSTFRCILSLLGEKLSSIIIRLLPLPPPLHPQLLYFNLIFLLKENLLLPFNCILNASNYYWMIVFNQNHIIQMKPMRISASYGYCFFIKIKQSRRRFTCRSDFALVPAFSSFSLMFRVAVAMPLILERRFSIVLQPREWFGHP